ncbi:MAG: hypothetical protein K1X94_09505 [Sandaracinaceae bacterium]|nr:hypothetical protein [Sandaracinaceae bacterium]
MRARRGVVTLVVAGMLASGCPGPESGNEDAGGTRDARVLDAPGLDAPGLDAPGLDAPGLDAGGPDAAMASSCGDPGSLLPAWYVGFTPSRVVYVAPDGDDAHDGSSADTAVRTTAAALRLATPGTEVRFQPGRYAGDGVCTYFEDLRGEEAHPIVLRSAGGPGAAELDCGRTSSMMLVRSRYVAIDGLDLHGAPDGAHVFNFASGEAPYLDATDHVVVHRSHFHDAGRHAIKFSQSSHITLVDDEFDSSRENDLLVSFVAVDDVVVAGCHAHDGGSFNQIKGGSQRSFWYRNLVERTGFGLLVGGDCTGRSFLVHTDADFEAEGVRAWDNVMIETARAFRFVSCHDCEVVHNTWLSSAPSQAMFMLDIGFDCGTPTEVPLHNRNIVVRNNVFSSSAPWPYAIAGTMPEGLVMDHNLWWAAGDPSRTGTDVPFSGEPTSIYDLDPGFADPPADLRPTVASPLIGGGVPVDWAPGNAEGLCWSGSPNVGAY